MGAYGVQAIHRNTGTLQRRVSLCAPRITIRPQRRLTRTDRETRPARRAVTIYSTGDRQK